MNKDFRRIFLTVLATLLVMTFCLAAIRMQALQDMVRDTLILPLYYSAWLVSLLLRSADQLMLWVVGLFALAVLMVYGLAMAVPEQQTLQPPRAQEGVAAPPGHGRVRFWRNKIEGLRTQGMDSEYANYEFRRLTKAVTASTEKEAALGMLAHPEELEPFFKKAAEGNGTLQKAPRKPPGALRRRLAALARRPIIPEQDPLVELCTFLEEQLEIEHDDSD